MLLAIDTCTRDGGVALWRGDTTIGSRCWYSPRNHTTELMGAIQQLLEAAEIGPRALDGIAVALGPGRFSALRVGISVAKGLALPWNIPLIGIGTLELEAYLYASTGRPVCPVIDLGRGEVATATFQMVRGRWKKLGEERVCTPEELVASIPKRFILCGEGIATHSEYLRQYLRRRGLIVTFHTQAARLSVLGMLGQRRLEHAGEDGLSALQPLYLRRPSISQARAPQRVKQ